MSCASITIKVITNTYHQYHFHYHLRYYHRRYFLTRVISKHANSRLQDLYVRFILFVFLTVIVIAIYCIFYLFILNLLICLCNFIISYHWFTYCSNLLCFTFVFDQCYFLHGCLTIIYNHCIFYHWYYITICWLFPKILNMQCTVIVWIPCLYIYIYSPRILYIIILWILGLKYKLKLLS